MDKNSKVGQIISSSKSHVAKIKEKIKNHKLINTKNAIIIACIVIVGALAFSYKGLLIAATVNGSPIYRAEVINKLEKESGKSTLDIFINQKLIESEAIKKGITIEDSEINAEIKNIEDQIKGQGKTLDEALKSEGLTLEELKSQISLQKKLERLLADKTQVTDEEVTKYIKDNEITIPKGKESDYNNQIKNTLQQQKMSEAVNELIDSLRSQVKIKYFVNY